MATGRQDPRFDARRGPQGPPSGPRGANFYGHLKRGALARRFRVNQLHAEALVENERRSLISAPRLVAGAQEA